MANTNPKSTTASCESKQTFLLTAINDISGNIKYLDTKVALIMATVGVFIGIVVSGINSFSVTITSKSLSLPTWFTYGFNTCTVLFGISIILVFVFGILTITARHSKPIKPSLWYFDDANIYPANFEEDIRKLTDDVITDNLSVELFNLNKINAQKMKHIKKAIAAFAVASVFSGLIVSAVAFYTLLI